MCVLDSMKYRISNNKSEGELAGKNKDFGIKK